MSVKIKICGVTLSSDAVALLEMGVDALGFNFCPQSPRYLDLESARHLASKLPPFGLRVGVFCGASFETVMESVQAMALDTIQLHGEEPPEIASDLREEGLRVWKAVRMQNQASLSEYADYPCDAYVIDAYHPKMVGGTGVNCDWDLLANWRFEKPWLLAGGLNPDNICKALTVVQPDGVDLASGVETAPGIKDLEAVRRLVGLVCHECQPA